MRNRIFQILFYSIPVFLNKGITLFFTPLYAIKLSVEDFGKLDLLFSFYRGLVFLFHFGWSSALVRFYLEPDIERKNLVKSILLFRIFTLGIVISSTFLIGFSKLSYLITRDSSLGIGIAGIILLFSASEFILFFTTRYRLEERVFSFVFVNILSMFLEVALILYFLLRLNLGVIGILWGKALAVGIIAIIYVIANIKWFLGGSFDFLILKKVLSYGVPLVGSSLAMFLITSADRYMILWLLPQKMANLGVGYYSFALKFQGLITLLSAGFTNFWSPYVYSSYRLPHAKKKFCFVFRNYTYFLVCFSLLIVISSPFVFSWFKKYSEGMKLIPLFLSSAVLYQIGDYFPVGIGISNKTWIRMLAGIIACGINLILNFIFIKKYGIYGAALGTLCSYGVYVILLMYFSHKYYPVNYPILLWIGGSLLILFSIFFYSEPSLLALYTCSAFALISLYYIKVGGIKRDWCVEIS